MKLFVWNRVDHATDNYHDEGGVMVIAETLDRARELLKGKTGKDERPCGALTKEPDLVRECEGPDYIGVFPDAGCC